VPILIDSGAVSAEISLIHLLTKAGTMFNRIVLLGPAALLAAACSSERPHPTDPTVAFSAVKFWEAGATVSWNQFATDLAQAAPAPGINTIRLYTYLSLAQFRAAEAAQAAPGRIRRLQRRSVALRSLC